MTNARREPTSDYLEAFETARERLPGGERLANLRRGAMERFASLGLPGRKVEEWRYADLKRLSRTVFAPANDTAAIDEAAIDTLRIPGLEGPVLVFVNGRFDRARSKLEKTTDGLTLRSLAEALEEDPEAAEAMLGDLREADALVQLNTAMMADGYLIELAPGTRLDRPVHIICCMTGAEGAGAHLRNLIRLGAGAKAEIVETYGGDDTGYLVNAVTQADLADGSELQLHRRQRESAQAVHLARSFVTLGNAGLTATGLSRGGASARHELAVTFTQAGGEARFTGIQLARGKQTLDTRTFMDHAVAGAESDQTYRGVLAAGAKGAFQGKVLVRRDAQKTNATQHAASLLLDRSAEADTKPELEIYADDVQCAHGATVGELDEDQLFYLTSRGLTPGEAKTVLIEAFVAEQLAGIETEAIREAMSEEARLWMEKTFEETDL